MNEPESFRVLITQLRAKDPQGADTLVATYRQRLLALVRSRLDARLLTRVEPDDVLQSALGSFFRRVEDGEFEFSDWNDLWGLLAQIAVRKSHRRSAHHRAQRRDYRREAKDQGAEQSDEPQPLVWQAAAREPTPDEEASLHELLDLLMQALTDDAQRRAVALRLQGCSLAEIAADDSVGLSERTLHRLMDKVKAWLGRRLGEQKQD